MGEDVSDMATTTSQLQAKLLALTGGQVDIMLDENTFKNSTQILREMADAWEDMTDIQRASALELMGGKRQANVLSALIQNFDTVEDVIEASANSAGSALEENEKYLDSIQGKIDQFTNATQAMWSNFLDADVVKDFVAFGTEIVKIIDKIGILGSALIALAAYKGFGAVFDIFNSAGISVEFLTKKLGSYLFGINTVAAAETTLTQAQVAQKLTQQGLTSAQAAAIAAQEGLATSTANLSRETLIAALQAQNYTAEEAEAIATKIFGATVTNASTGALLQETIQLKLANSALIQYAIQQKLATAEEVANMTITQLLALGFHGLATAIGTATKAIAAFLFTNPVGWAILAATAIIGVVAAWNAWGPTTENLTEKLSELKSELSDIRSELDSVNSELETTNERMAELLAKDKLTFQEQEELDRLRATNDELERRKTLLEDEEKSKSEIAGRQAARVVKRTREETLDDGWRFSAYSAEEYIQNKIEKYRETKDKLNNASSLKEQDKYQKKLDKQSEKIDNYILSLSNTLDGVEYGDSKESDEALDYLAELQDTYAIARGSASAKTNAIKGLFNKDEFAETKTAIDGYVDALANGDTSAAGSIANIIESNKDLVQDLEVRGLKAQDAIDHFTKLGSEANFATLEGKITEMQSATSKIQTLLSNTKSADFTGLFDKDGEVSETALAEYFQDTSEATRTEIAKLVKDINDGEISVENALKQFEIFSIQSSLDIYITEVQTNFKDVFVDLEDADGLINTFEELGEAIGSAASALDTLNQAQAEMAYSGHVSIETALQLMEYTDDYGSVLQVVDGKLQLVEGAEQNLIQARINAIKTSAEASLSDATNAYNKAVLATQEYKSALTTNMSAEVVAKSWEKVLAAGAGLWEGIKSLITDESWTDAYNRGYNTTLSQITGYETEYNDAGLQALAEAEADAKALMEQAQDRVDLANQLTPETLESIHSSEEASGGNKTKEEVEDDRFQREMDYWENRIGANQAKYEQLQNEIDLLEAKGQKASEAYYKEQIKLENERKTLLKGQKAAAEAYLATLTEGSEEWWEVANTLNDIEGELDDVTASIVDLQDAIAEIDTYKFEEFNTRLDNLISKLGTIRDLIAPDGEEDWFDDQGQWTEEGVAVLGTYIQELETYKQGLEETGQTLKDFGVVQFSDGTWGEIGYAGNEQWYKDKHGIHSEQEYYDKLEELKEQQYKFAESINDTEQSIVDMYDSSIDAVEEYTESLIDNYNDYIDSVKEALDAERDLYDFKKKVKNQTKEIAAIERRIASLSGSTNASDIAERRRLEADLYGAREELDDTYYDHAKTTQQEALDSEAQAYEETMNKFIEGLRTGLDQATANMDEFLMSVTSMVTLNADTVLQKYQETELPLGGAITNPWEAAKKAVGDYSGDALDLMNKWTQGGFFTTFPETVKGSLTSPWSAGSTAADAFQTSVSTVMEGVVSNISTNVKTASGELSKLYQQIIDTEKKASEVVVPPVNTLKKPILTPGPATPPPKTVSATAYLQIGYDVYSASGSGSTLSTAQSDATDNVLQKAYNAYKSKGYDDSWMDKRYSAWKKNVQFTKPVVGNRVQSTANSRQNLMLAKGTTGTARDQWAITDEPQFGDELVLVPGKDGNLSFMRKGTGVVPADLTQKLFELAQIPTSDLMNKNLTAIVPNITKNDFKNEFNFESLVHVDTVDSDTLPKLEKMVDKKIDDFSKALNYSLKRFAR